MEAKVALVTDSTACLPQELVERYNIQIVPIQLIHQGRAYRDGVDITAEEFYHLLEKADKLPTTASASPGAFLEVFRQLSRTAGSILCITLSSRVSAMYDSARTAQKTARELILNTAIYVLDSGTAAMAQGFIVLKAARTAEKGGSLEEVLQAAQSLMPKVHLVALLDTLYYLAKGGRIPQVAAWAGSVLDVKPLVQMRNGEVSLLDRVRGKARALDRLLEVMKERVAPHQPLHIAFFHSNVPEEAEKLKERVTALFPCEELYITPFTPVMGVHTGPGLLGVAFYNGD